MKFKKSLLVVGGVVASLAALTPMATYAVTAPTKTSGVSITVSPAITITTTQSYSGTADVAQVNTGKIGATITSNTKYTISLSADNPALTDVDAATNGNSATIPAASGALTAGTRGWGVKKDTSAGGDGTYTAITTSPVVFYNSTAGAQAAPTQFDLGIAISSDLPSGTYQTTVTVTAATV